jgi:hypothetical protein
MHDAFVRAFFVPVLSTDISITEINVADIAIMDYTFLGNRNTMELIFVGSKNGPLDAIMRFTLKGGIHCILTILIINL